MAFVRFTCEHKSRASDEGRCSCMHAGVYVCLSVKSVVNFHSGIRPGIDISLNPNYEISLLLFSAQYVTRSNCNFTSYFPQMFAIIQQLQCAVNELENYCPLNSPEKTGYYRHQFSCHKQFFTVSHLKIVSCVKIVIVSML